MNRNEWADIFNDIDQEYINHAAEKYVSGRWKGNVPELETIIVPPEKPRSRASRIINAAASAAAIAALVVGCGFIVDYVNRNKVQAEINPAPMTSSAAETSAVTQETVPIETTAADSTDAAEEILWGDLPESVDRNLIPIYEETEQSIMAVKVSTVNSAGKDYFYATESETVFNPQSEHLIKIIDENYYSKTYKETSPMKLENGLTCISSEFYFTESGPVRISVIGDWRKDCYPSYILVFYDNEMNVIKSLEIKSHQLYMYNDLKNNGSESETYRQINISKNGRFFVELTESYILVYDTEQNCKPVRIEAVKSGEIYNSTDIIHYLDIFDSHIAISSDGKKIFAAGQKFIEGEEKQPGKNASYIDLSGNEAEIHEIKADINPHKTIFPESGTLMYYDDNFVEFITPDNHFRKEIIIEDEKIINVAISQNERYVLVASKSGKTVYLRLYERTDGKAIEIYAAPSVEVSSIAVADSSRIAGIEAGTGKIVVPFYLWDTAAPDKTTQTAAKEQTMRETLSPSSEMPKTRKTPTCILK